MSATKDHNASQCHLIQNDYNTQRHPTTRPAIKAKLKDKIKALPNFKHLELIFNALPDAFLIGGCVRDILLGRPPNDFDFASPKIPSEVIEIFNSMRLSTLDIGGFYGSISVIIEGINYEITTFRSEGEYLDFRRPKQISFSKTLAEDVLRRDFSINALALNKDLEIIDLVGGLYDLNKRILRCIGEPRERFLEDALRILRAIDFSLRFDFQIEPKTLSAMHEFCPNLCAISKERLTSQWLKILESKYNNQDLSGEIVKFRDILNPVLTLRKIPYQTSSKNPMLKCACLIERSNYLRLSKKDQKSLDNFNVLVTLMHQNLSDYEISKAIFLYGEDAKIAMLDSKNASKLKKILESKAPLSLRELAISGSDVLEMAPSLRKKALLLAMDYVLKNPRNNQKQVLLDLLKSQEL